MNALDLFLVALMVVGAVGGYRIGLVSRATSWAGLALGLFVAARALPWVADRMEDASEATTFVVAAGLLIGGAFGGQAIGYFVGSRIQTAVRSDRLVQVDRVGGAAAGVVGVLIAVWLLAPALADLDGWESREVRGSAVVGAVADVFPEAPDATRTLRRLLGENYPQVFESLRPAPELGPPPAESGIDQDTADRVARSVLRIEGRACGRIQEGSGFVARPGLVVTNAHVVAGEQATDVIGQDGRRLEATTVAFDPAQDLAVLAVPALDAAALPLVAAEVGDKGATFGHPGGGPLELSPFVVGERVEAVGSDIYHRERTRRDVLVLAADLEPGDSGSAMVDPRGRARGIAFATAPDRDGVAYALDVTEIESVLDRAGRRPVDTGPCVD